MVRKIKRTMKTRTKTRKQQKRTQKRTQRTLRKQRKQRRRTSRFPGFGNKKKLLQQQELERQQEFERQQELERQRKRQEYTNKLNDKRKELQSKLMLYGNVNPGGLTRKIEANSAAVGDYGLALIPTNFRSHSEVENFKRYYKPTPENNNIDKAIISNSLGIITIRERLPGYVVPDKIKKFIKNYQNLSY